MAVELPQGTKEHLVVDVDDELNNLPTLDGTTPQFRVLMPDPDDADKVAWTSTGLTVQVMKLFCLIDTSVGPWDGGTYRLYVRFTTAPELPVLGPFEFDVVAP